MPARPPMPAPQLLESPAVRRSAMLAKLLEEQRKPVDIRGGYGELGARLLAQGITQWGANRAEREVGQERQQRFEGQLTGTNAMLAGLLARSGRGEVPETEMPAPMPDPSATAPTATAAPVNQVMGSNLPAAGQPIPPADVPPAAPVPMAPALTPMPMPEAPPVAAPAPQMAPPPAPQAAPNALGITPGEQARLERLVRVAQETGDPALLAYVQSELDGIEARMSAPSAERNQIIDRNGVSYMVDPAGVGSPRQVFEGSGVPAASQTDTFLADENNEFGVSPGTLLQRSPNGVISVVNKPPEGMSRIGGRVVNEPGYVDATSERQRTTQNIETENRREQERPQFESRLGRIAETTTTIQEEVAYAQRIIAANPDAVGLIGSVAARIPGTPAHDLQKALESIGANIGFEYLQDMRNSNPTGGGVGALSDSERNALSSTAGSLAQSQSADRLNMSLGRISRLTQAGSDRARQMYEATYRSQAPSQEEPRPQPRNPRPASPAPRAPAPAAPRRSNGQTRRYNPNTGRLE